MKRFTYWIFIVGLGIFLSELAYAADSNIRYKDMPVTPPSVPPIQGSYGGTDICVVSRAGGLNAGFFGISGGVQVRDMNCERIKLSRAMAQLGLKISATAILCQDSRVFEAMVAAGSPCPVNGKIGDEAIKEYRKRGILDEENNVIKNPMVTPVKFDVDKPKRRHYGQPVN
ncbi:MAG TPA: hypothetical protein DCM40_13035 [Maribacter sp.]|nr:hypothetical protein [Maribacter sp.]|tara:strand:- start:307 stop:819 length:513 start_codon:yes stop_codon:yes gene_type:complete